MRRLKATPQPISLRTVHLDPYRVRTLRKQIDGAAFRIYGHWVKKNDGQNRAAMFEHSPKEWSYLLIFFFRNIFRNVTFDDKLLETPHLPIMI